MASQVNSAYPPPDREDGFTLVEVLVTLVIAAMLAMAIGALTSFAVGLRDRSEQIDKTIAAVLDLEALRSVILEAAGPARYIGISNPTEAGFALLATAAASSHLPIAVAIGRTTSGGPLSVSLAFGDDVTAASTSVDLSPFDQASIDYLDGTGNKMAWRSSDSLAGVPLAARLKLAQDERRWTIPLWIVPRGSMQ